MYLNANNKLEYNVIKALLMVIRDFLKVIYIL